MGQKPYAVSRQIMAVPTAAMGHRVLATRRRLAGYSLVRLLLEGITVPGVIR